jgi:hypothetical protein
VWAEAYDATAISAFSLQDQAGEALRVYARMLDGQLEYALATRGLDGKLILGSWQHFAAEPTLTWSAQETDRGYQLISAQWR